MMRTVSIILVSLAGGLVALATAGCDATVYAGGTNPMPMNASATGVWGGTDSVTGLNVAGYIDQAGEAVFIRADGVQFAGATQVSGDTIVAAGVGYANFGSTVRDGWSRGPGPLNGPVAGGSTLTLSLSFTTNGGT